MKKYLILIPLAAMTALSGCKALTGKREIHTAQIQTKGLMATLRISNDDGVSIENRKLTLLRHNQYFELNPAGTNKIMQGSKFNFTDQDTLQFELGFYLDTGQSILGWASYKINYSVTCERKDLFDECYIKTLNPIYQEDTGDSTTIKYLNEIQADEGTALNKVMPENLTTTYEVPTAHGIRTIKNRLLSQKIHFSTNKEGDINFSLPGNNMQVSVVMNLNSASLLESSIEMWPTKKGPGLYDYHAEKAKVKKIIDSVAK
ncbi:hypothetical protein VB547_19775 [Vibrio parahaemolyticus]|uniref:hypothetical protein n=1 Tax=Gammaproteobacteria TaxID=1236 RepID=UPI002B1FD153|nr:hypothetical protein [Vibrio parahaemolyticus]MEA5303681.1 hypothetical protein [Vibrio parahaemolyticus]